MSQTPFPVTALDPPPPTRVSGSYASTNLADAYAVDLPDDATLDPEALARFVFLNSPDWAKRLMQVRDGLVAGLGLKTAKRLEDAGRVTPRRRVGIFRIYEKHSDEIVLGEDDRHLDFRISLLRQPAGATSPPRLIVSTVVHCHNRLGRGYILLIAPFHRLIVKACLRRAARLGWPAHGAA